MKILKKTIFAIALLVGFSTMALAQKEGDKNNPPQKKNPPIVVVKPDKEKEKPKENKPQGDKKKPQAIIFFGREESNLG